MITELYDVNEYLHDKEENEGNNDVDHQNDKNNHNKPRFNEHASAIDVYGITECFVHKED